MIRTHQALTLTLVGCGLAGGFYSVSCIIPDTGTTFTCGKVWSGEATDAQGEQGGDAVQIHEGNPPEDVVDSLCMSPAEHEALHEGVDADCHTITNPSLCGGCCEWTEFEIDGRSAEVCIFNNAAYQAAFRKLTEAIVAKCESVAVGQSIDPYPCETISDAGVCNAKDYCTWAAAGCVFDYETCTTAAIKTAPFTANEACPLTAEECDGGGTGGGTGECEIPGTTGTTGVELPDPSKVITHIGGTRYQIDSAFWDFITLPENQPLLLGDDARLQPYSTGGFELVDVDPGSYAYELGLRSGDVLLELNGNGLADLEEVYEAINDVADDTYFELEFNRSGNTYTYSYTII